MIFSAACRAKEGRIEESHLMREDVHLMIVTPPKCAASQVMGLIKCESHSIWREPMETTKGALPTRACGLMDTMRRLGATRP